MDVHNQYGPGSRLYGNDLVKFGREIVSDQDPCTAFFIGMAETLCCCFCGNDYFDDYFKDRAIQHIEYQNTNLIRKTIIKIAKKTEVSKSLLEGIRKKTNEEIKEILDQDRKKGGYEIMGEGSPLFITIKQMLNVSITALNLEKLKESKKALKEEIEKQNNEEIEKQKQNNEDLQRQLEEIENANADPEVTDNPADEVTDDSLDEKSEVEKLLNQNLGEEPPPDFFARELPPGEEGSSETGKDKEETRSAETETLTPARQTEETAVASSVVEQGTFFDAFAKNPIGALSLLLIKLTEHANYDESHSLEKEKLEPTKAQLTTLNKSLIKPFLKGFKKFPIGSDFLLDMLNEASTELKNRKNLEDVKAGMHQKIRDFIDPLDHDALVSIKAVIDKLPDFTSLAFTLAPNLPTPDSVIQEVTGISKLSLTIEALGIKASDPTYPAIQTLLTLIFTHYDALETYYYIDAARTAVKALKEAFNTEKDALDQVGDVVGEAFNSAEETLSEVGNFFGSFFDNEAEKKAREEKIVAEKAKQAVEKQRQIQEKQKELQAEQDRQMKMGLKIFIRCVLIENIDRFAPAFQ